MTENIYLTYYELCKSVPLLARKAIIMAYEETGNISLRWRGYSGLLARQCGRCCGGGGKEETC